MDSASTNTSTSTSITTSTCTGSGACIPCLPPSHRSQILPQRKHTEVVHCTSLNTISTLPTPVHMAAGAAVLAACTVLLATVVLQSLQHQGQPSRPPPSNPLKDGDTTTQGEPPATITDPAPTVEPASVILSTAGNISGLLGSVAAVRPAGQAGTSAGVSPVEPGPNAVKAGPSAVKPGPSAPPHHRPSTNTRSHQRAAARAKQASLLASAARLLRRGEDARAHVELLRAVEHNSMCHMPCEPDAAPDRDARLQLYLLHLRSQEGTPRLGLLVQVKIFRCLGRTCFATRQSA